MGINIGILGSGEVARALAKGFAAEGHKVRMGTRDPAKLAHLAAQSITTGSFGEVAAGAEVVVLAVKGTAAEGLVRELAPRLAGKVVIDACNPIADDPPEDGIVRFFTGPNESLMERLQVNAPGARFVKAFSCVGNHLMVHPQLPGGPPTMFICGNDGAAKAQVRGLVAELGWDTEDTGTAKGARAIEPLCQLWVARGFNQNQWAHAFKLLRA